MKNLIALLSIICLSCGTKYITYDKLKIEKKFSDKYSLYLDSVKIDFDNYYVDKENIQNVFVNRRKRSITINRIRSKILENFFDLRLDTIENWDEKNIELYIIDGVPYDEQMIGNLFFERGSIKQAQILLGEDLAEKAGFGRKDRNILLITTK